VFEGDPRERKDGKPKKCSFNPLPTSCWGIFAKTSHMKIDAILNHQSAKRKRTLTLFFPFVTAISFLGALSSRSPPVGLEEISEQRATPTVGAASTPFRWCWHCT
jgi:hypothetical protein